MGYSGLVVGLLLSMSTGRVVLADQPAAAPADADEPKTLPQTSFFSSLKQAMKQGYDHEVVRGHFELGTPPNLRRYYCLIDVKTGAKDPNGVVGEPLPLPDGMTGFKYDSVSLYSCAAAEKAGMLVTAGYVIPNRRGSAGPTAAASAAATAAVVAAPAPLTALPLAVVPEVAKISVTQIDVAGIRLGMSPEEVRAVLKSKRLLDYNESAQTLSYLDSSKGAMQQVPSGRFVNVIAAWSPPPPSSTDNYQTDGEAIEVLFTPVPGKERVLGIVHTVGYSPTNAIHETALESGLVKKYGGFAGSNDLPESPTWRVQTSGNVQIGDPCGRRGILGGLGGLTVTNGTRQNLALKKSPEDLKSQVDHCGVAIVSEDHFTANGGALREDRLVSRFTITAYSPSLALEGANTAAQLIQAAGGPAKKFGGAGAKDQPASNL